MPSPRRLLCLGLAASLAAGGAAFAQTQSGLDAAKAGLEAAKAESDARGVLERSATLARTNPAEAARLVRTLIFDLSKRADLDPMKRADLTRRLEARLLAITQPGAAQPAPTAAPVAPAKPAAPLPAPTLSAMQIEAKDIVDGVREVTRLYEVNQFAGAASKINDLTKKYPNNPAVITLASQASIGDRVSAAKAQAREQADRVNSAMKQVDQSARPSTRDVEYPAGWGAKMAKREDLTREQLTPETESILRALEAKVPTPIKDAPFYDAVEQLSTLIGKTIVVNKNALAEDNQDLRKPVSAPGGVSARTALRVLVQSQGMTFVIKEDVIQVVTVEEARRMLVKRAYYVGDILGGPVSGGATYGPLADLNAANQQAQIIVDSIKRSIDPGIWEGANAGGFASVSYSPVAQAIVVSAPAEVQASVARQFAPRR